MVDPKQIRLSDADDPDRATKFAAALKSNAANGNAVIRQLVDAYIRFVKAQGTGPVFPVDIVPSAAKPKSGK